MSASNLVAKATHKIVKNFHLKNIKRIEIKFDPFSSSATSVRNFLFHLSSTKVRQSNIKCSIKTTVVNDRSEPEACITVETGHKYILKAGNLTSLELVEEFSKLLKKYNPDSNPSDKLAVY